MATAGLAWRQTLREALEMLEIALEFNWRVGRATRLNLPRTLDLDKLTLRQTCPLVCSSRVCIFSLRLHRLSGRSICVDGSSPPLRLDMNMLMHLPFTIYFPPSTNIPDPFTRRLHFTALCLCLSLSLSLSLSCSLLCATYLLSLSLTSRGLTLSSARVILPLLRPADPRYSTGFLPTGSTPCFFDPSAYALLHASPNGVVKPVHSVSLTPVHGSPHTSTRSGLDFLQPTPTAALLFRATRSCHSALWPRSHL